MGYNTNILADIRQYCVGQPEDEFFDPTLLSHVNSAFLELKDIGALKSPFEISTKEETWNDIPDDFHILPYIKEWIEIKVKMLFDPPKSSTQTEAYNAQLNRLEWRMYSTANYQPTE